MTEQIVVYTAISGSCDTLRNPDYVTPGFSWVCFTDNPHLNSNVWEIRPLPSVFFDSDGQRDYVRQAKMPKILPHEFFPQYDISLWIDGNLQIRGDLKELVHKYLSKCDMALFRHPEARANLGAEVEACIRFNKDNPEILRLQYCAYQASGIPEECPLPACMVIARRHHSPRIAAAMTSWWEEIKTHSRRDQISFPYIAWKHNLDYATIDEDVRDNRWFLWQKHEIKRRIKSLRHSYSQSDVNFLSFPKSGQTWVRYFLASYLERRFGISFDLELQHANQILRISFKHDYAQIYQDCPGKPRILFPDELHARRLVVLVRDPRDVSVHYFYQKSLRERFSFKNIEEFLKSDIYGIRRQAHFVNLLLDFYATHPGPKLLLHYELLQTTPEREYGRLLGFLFGKIDAKKVAEAVEEASIERMHSPEGAIINSPEWKDQMGRLGVAEFNGQLNAFRVQKGRRGGYRRELPLLLRWRIGRLPEVRKLIDRLNQPQAFSSHSGK